MYPWGRLVASDAVALRTAGLPPVSLNAACTRGTMASQSVVTTTTPTTTSSSTSTTAPAGTVLAPRSIVVSYAMPVCPP
jgi:hypothetical protein